MKTTRKLFALLLVVSLVAGMLAIGVFAAGGAQIVSQQLSLGDDLTMRFDVAVDSQYQNDAVISVAVAGNTDSYNVAEMTAGENGNYQVYVDLAAAQMTENIAVSVVSGGNVLAEGSYSVRAYCQYLLDGDYTDATKQMVLQVLNYGAKAQTYFGYNPDDLANADNELETVATVPTEGYTMTVDGKVSGITLRGTSLVFESKVAIRYYFAASDISAYTFTVNGSAYEAQEKEAGLYYVEVPNINPQSYADMVNLVVSNGTQELTVGYSPLSYIVRMSAKAETSANLKDLLSAMYGYYLEAKDFVGVQVNDNRVTLPVHIIADEVVGTWTDAKLDSASLGPQNSYDGDTATNWNPAITDFMSDEGIVYTLDNTYDISNVVLTTHRIYYFNLYGSADGVNYEQILRVGSSNAADYYAGEVGAYTCDISGLNAAGVKYLKIVFTGCVNIDATHISLYEVEISGKKPFAVEDGRGVADSVILSHAIKGSWANDREDTSGSAAKTYDGNTGSNWNPAVSSFKSEAAVVYTLDALTELTDVTVTFGSRLHYFDLSISTDGESYTHIARINAATASKYYDGLAAAVENINQNARYIRLDFLGTENGTTWINMMEIVASGKAPVAVDDGREVYNSIIVANDVEGTWVQDRIGDSKIGPEMSYDGSTTSNWNPQATNYKSGEAIVYTLDSLTELTNVTLTFGTREYYFDLSVSVDGETYTHIARVNSVTAAKYFNGLVATVPVNMNARYIRLDFLGSANGTTYISLMEIAAAGKAPVIADDGRAAVDYAIIANSVEGTWVNDRIGDSKIGPEMSYDDSTSTIWNPQATNYKSGEAIVYTLDKAYDLEQVAITCGTREYYFDLSVSGDGLNYTHIARVNADTASRYFDGLVATVDGIGVSGVKYVKLSFLGSANGTTYVSVADMQLTCKEYVADTSNAVTAVIAGNEIIGTWVKSHEGSASAGPERSYDGDATTNWNPQVTNFKSGEGIIYTLDKAYDLTEISLTFGTRLHYFDLYVSADGETYLPVASITADNAAEYFNGLVATVDNLTNTNVVYIKVLFTGTETGTTFINLFESAAQGN